MSDYSREGKELALGEAAEAKGLFVMKAMLAGAADTFGPDKAAGMALACATDLLVATEGPEAAMALLRAYVEEAEKTARELIASRVQ
jgi:hypothetical protein